MPRAVCLVTRPQPQADGFAARLRTRFGKKLPIVLAPILRLQPYALPDPMPQVAIVSSSSALHVLAGAPRPPAVLYCVGQATTERACAAGLNAQCAGTDAAQLVAHIAKLPDPGPMVHLRGRDTRGDIAAKLRALGRVCDEFILYRQQEQPLTDRAQAQLMGSAPVLLPLFSPRSAALVGAAAHKARAPLWLATLSPAVAQGWDGPRPARQRGASRPDTPAMLDAIAELIAAD